VIINHTGVIVEQEQKSIIDAQEKAPWSVNAKTSAFSRKAEVCRGHVTKHSFKRDIWMVIHFRSKYVCISNVLAWFVGDLFNPSAAIRTNKNPNKAIMTTSTDGMMRTMPRAAVTWPGYGHKSYCTHAQLPLGAISVCVYTRTHNIRSLTNVYIRLYTRTQTQTHTHSHLQSGICFIKRLLRTADVYQLTNAYLRQRGGVFRKQFAALRRYRWRR